MMGIGKRYPASAGSDAFSSIVVGDRHAFEGVRGGITHLGNYSLVGIFGLSKSYPVHLSLAV